MFDHQYYFKCEEYQEAIDLLESDEAKTNDAKIHLAYYACFLYMKHILRLFFEYENILTMTRSKIQSTYKGTRSGGGIHVALIVMFRNFIGHFHVCEKEELNELNNILEELKSARVIASYKKNRLNDETTKELLDSMDFAIEEFEHLEKKIKTRLNNNNLSKFNKCLKISKKEWIFLTKNNRRISFPSEPI